ncbi:MAG: hypothetical protein ACYC7A_21855 [Thermoanaerobaculia bacterium]
MDMKRIAALIVIAFAIAAQAHAASLRHAGVKQIPLRDVSIESPIATVDDQARPSVAVDQNPTSERSPRVIIGNPVQDKDIPQPCDPSLWNLWCAGSTTSTCKANMACDPTEGDCLTGASTKCYTYEKDGATKCATCT